MMPDARERFIAKCEFMPSSGCVIWRGGTTSARAGTERTGVFWDRGKKHIARRWAAEHIHGLDLLGKHVELSCGEPLCVQHVIANSLPFANPGQFYVFHDMGMCDLPERPPRPDHSGAPFFDPPEWMREMSDTGIL